MQVQPLYLCLLGTNPAAKVFEVFIYLFIYLFIWLCTRCFALYNHSEWRACLAGNTPV